MRAIILLLLFLTPPAQAVKWQIKLTLLPELREGEEERRVREAHLAEAKRRRRGPIAGVVLGTLLCATGMALLMVGAEYRPEVSTRIDPNSATVFSEPVHGRNNWIEMGVGLSLMVAGTPTMGSQLVRLGEVNEQVRRYSPP